MNKQDALKPADIAVVLALAVRRGAPRAPFSELGAALGLSASTVFHAVRRLGSAGLLRAGSREPNRSALRNFVAHGVRHAFPPALGGQVRGVSTAYSGPPLRGQFETERDVVWPQADGPARGTGLAPLYPQATGLPERAPEVYRALTLVDAVRIGRARERHAALTALDGMLLAGRNPPSEE